MLVITSFNESLLKQYGKRMVQEFSEKSDGTVKLVVIYEGDSLPEIYLILNSLDSIIWVIMNLFVNSGTYKKLEECE
jgi:hypothetical protein